MKKVRWITGFTDYPFTELGDEYGSRAPVRKVNVVDYDGDKYATVQFPETGHRLQVKIGYLYSHRGRLGQVKQINPRKIERNFGF